MTALMKRLSLSAEDKERSAAVSEIVDLVKKGGVGALKVLQLPSLLTFMPIWTEIRQLSLLAALCLLCSLLACEYEET